MIDNPENISPLPQTSATEPVIEVPEPRPSKRGVQVIRALVITLVASAVGVGAFLVKSQQNQPLPSPSPMIIPSPSPSPLLSPSPVASPSTKLIIVSPKPVNKYPYTLVSDYKDVTATGWNKTSEGGKDGPFGVRAHLTDAGGNIVVDQLGVVYKWVAADPSIVTVDPGASCSQGIQPPCPEEYATFVGTLENTGKTTVTVTAFKDGKQISNTYVFNVTIEKAANPTGPVDRSL